MIKSNFDFMVSCLEHGDYVVTALFQPFPAQVAADRQRHTMEQGRRRYQAQAVLLPQCDGGFARRCYHQN